MAEKIDLGELVAKSSSVVDTVERVKREVEDIARDTLGINWETR